MRIFGLFISVLFIQSCGPDFSSQLSFENEMMFEGEVPDGGWENPYYEDPKEVQQARLRGLRHTLIYPILDHSATMPFRIADGLMKRLEKTPRLSIWLKRSGLAKFGTSWDEMFSELGLEKHGDLKVKTGPFAMPDLKAHEKKFAMGVTVGTNSRGVKVFTYSCAACHVRNLFGKPVIGLNSLKSRAYEYVSYAKTLSSLAPNVLIQLNSGYTKAERNELIRTKEALKWVKSPTPRGASLDTSIAAVSASLDLRSKDSFASRVKTRGRGRNIKDIMHGGFDSKPGTWWLFKYKNKFLSDGSVRGNPIVTNILWNEIGRGGDVRGLGQWFEENQNIIADLTTAVMETEAPKWSTFFEGEFDLDKAKKGEILFEQTCSGCHGSYEKNWSSPTLSGDESLAFLMQTSRVDYHSDTPTIDVGTDPRRAEGIKYLAKGLNHLKISQEQGAKTIHTGGYVPQPLVGIWARWPYFHDGSAASLCEVLTASKKRLKRFYIPDAKNSRLDYDSECVGAPRPERLTNSRKEKSRLYQSDSSFRVGGHDEGIFIEDGKEVFSREEKFQIIEFLKSL